jgi:transposase-like protein
MDRRNGFPQTWQEARRKRAFELKQLGWKQYEIAQALGVSSAAVSQWLTTLREHGVAGQAEAQGADQTRRRPMAFDPRALIPRCRSIRLSRRVLDLRPRGDGDRGGVRRLVPQGPYLTVIETLALDSPDAD